jgi:fructose-bisphosphate aldolase class I
MTDPSLAEYSLVQDTARKNDRCSGNLVKATTLLGASMLIALGCVGLWQQAASTPAIDMAALTARPMASMKVQQPMPSFPNFAQGKMVGCGGLRGVACAGSQTDGNPVKEAQMKKMTADSGFISALDESGGTSPKTLAAYGVPVEEQGSQDEMMAMVHDLRAKIMMNERYKEGSIIGAILFEDTINRNVDGVPTVQYLWEKKKVVPFLKSDVGLAPAADGVQMMKDHPGLEDMLDRGLAKGVWGTKQRSQIQSANAAGIKALVKQQFEYGKRTIAKGMVPILEPEVDITAADKAKIEDMLLPELIEGLKTLGPDDKVIFKLSLPEKANLYKPLLSDPHVVRVVALSGGYDLAESNKRLSQNDGMIASFSRTLREGLSKSQSDAEFTETLGKTLDAVNKASAAR